MNELLKDFEKGSVNHLTKSEDASGLNWNPHATMKGVFLKHLVKGADTGGHLSCHIVRIEAGQSITDHIHDGKMELHEVISGEGRAILGEKKIAYQGGVITIIPENIHHSVTAGKEDLFLFAKFIPALL